VAILSKTVVIAFPTSAENVVAFFIDRAITITQVRGVIKGTTSATFNLFHSTDRSAAGTAVLTSNLVCSSVTSGTDGTIDAGGQSVAANSWVFLKTQALSGSPSELAVYIEWTED
jgi:uncharacterized protein with beta-barrel porin domain